MKRLIPFLLLLLFTPSCIFVISTSEESERRDRRNDDQIEAIEDVDGSAADQGLQALEGGPQIQLVRDKN